MVSNTCLGYTELIVAAGLRVGANMRGAIVPVVVEEVLDAALDAGHLQQLMDAWSLCWIPFQHHGQDIGHIAREVGWQRSIFTLDDSLGKLV